MKNRILFLTFMCSLLAGVVLAANDQRVRITANSVNLRSGASGNAGIVRVASRGDVLVATGGLSSEWVAVKLPSAVGLWVYGELVRNGIVSVPKLDARSGAGIDKPIVCSFKQGDQVTIKGHSGDWLKVATPPDCVLYVSGRYVEPVSTHKPKKAIRPKKIVRPKKTVVRLPEPVKDIKPPKPRVRALTRVDIPLVSSVVAPSSPKVLPRRSGSVFSSELLIPSRSQGVKIVCEGVLRKAGPIFGRPARYRLAMRDDKGRVLTRCYVKGNSAQLTSFLGRNLRIEGAEYWLKGIRLSVVVPSRIVLND